MGKKGYNWKARKVTQIEIDDTLTKKIAVDIGSQRESYDQCNALVIPSQKRKTKSKDKKITTTRLLSKKRRKELEKVVDRKRKKANRATLLDKLAKVQVSEEELKQYTTLAAVQTRGLKRHFNEVDKELKPKPLTSEPEEEQIIVNAIRGAKQTRLSLLGADGKQNTQFDPNIVGFDESSDDETKSEDDFEQPSSIVKPAEESVNAKIQRVKNDVTVNKPHTTSDKNRDKIRTDKVALNNVDPVQRKPAVFVMLDRKPEIQTARLKLPILAEEQSIMETINDNPVVIVAGETGSGKTTQVPQFLYEAGYAKEKMIGVTEPRRVAAISMSKRVAEEMNLSSKEVSYLIRFEGNTTSDTKIKFMTDGVLLKEIQSDFLLNKYSVIILDEAHERSVYTDILIGLLSRIVPLRNKRKSPLKLIVMSATLRIEDFTENPKLFKVKPPVIKVESRQFPVTIHFNKRTSQNYVKDALYKAVKIHTQLPDGGILIFLTGQQEVNTIVRKLRKAFPLRNKKFMLKKQEAKEIQQEKEPSSNNSESDEGLDMDRVVKNARKHRKKLKEVKLPELNLDNYAVMPPDDTEGDLLDTVENRDAEDKEEEEDDDDDDEEEDLQNLMGLSCTQPMWVLPLYSLLPSYKQAKVFDPPPEGCRLCVVSTNVAETSLTIPNVKYVVDSGRCKTRLYDKVTGVNAFQVCYTSKAAANQRAGRAGRTGPGHCYRLYSSAVFNDQFEQFSMPEIQRKPVDDLLLQMKVMNIDKVVNFPFPSSPDVLQLKSAEKRLCILGALDQSKPGKENEYCAKVTPLGYSIAAFPVAPRFGKMLALSQQHDLLQYTVCLVAALSVQEVLIESNPIQGVTKNQWNQTRRTWAGTGNSLLLGDAMVLVRAVGAAEYAGSKGTIVKFCEENGLRYKAVTEIRKLRQQLTNEIVLNIPDLDLNVNPRMNPPTDTQAKLLRQILLSGMANQVARKVSPDEVEEDHDKVKWKYAYRCLEMEDPVFMHSSSVLKKTYPEWVVYQEVYETNKIYMRGITAIQPEWLPKFATSLCQLSEPVSDPPPRYDSRTGKVMCHVTGTFGRGGWQLPLIEVEYPNSLEGIKWFARFFLEGQVCPALERFASLLLSTPGTMNKTWAKLLPRTEAITKALMANQVSSKDQLYHIWKTDSKFLLNAYQKWLPESAQNEVAILWPPL
ncbi:probable ATP-dependent RNA helicase kurz isoform X1 [Neodiprion lecontei]|uniref:Probable ATP-dependent RNA helicase kurz isoform X1 n=1 Tax=Neodiprion lecontei TaxID=441921 RepID=A0A6J0BE71_NEOLC|nr:probable ATP-dependent RNA helicase kurz isoform X1 [Neodiprion lecontei]XP_015512447.2 probable ATP-dependent RNA helicase kurz isoform X1 [Neodiprion lecontei]